MNKAIYLTDLDGTLLSSNATLSEFTIRVLKDSLEEGAIISYATARSYQSSNAIVSQIPWIYPLVLYNGALLYDPVHKSVLDGYWLDPETTNVILQLGRSLGIMPLLFALDKEDQERVWHEKLFRTGDLEFAASRPNDPRFHEVAELECPQHLRTLIITFIGHLDELIPLKNAVITVLGERVHLHLMKDTYIKDHYFLEFSHPLANKQEGLRLWAAYVGCAGVDVTVFGDNLNDVGMFLAAGTKVAVANAHPDLLLMADEVISCNDQDGVAAYIAAKSKEISG
ncbi:HAD-IIB family hydrolase [Paenibacillus alba]|uniref:HAD-IIB family hydrolase n=1 Tax=Paenibacillus alba TaxID=1197127 RepID=UPI0015650A90|nr:HAD-IIB family hydrolase [Paenibacillus alba]NQX67745.1 HAD-IIB family hydrolase [Paenibacillus alba]